MKAIHFPAWTTVAVFDQLPPAEALQAFLEKAGCRTRIHDERRIQRYWFWVSPQAGIQVQVPKLAFTQVNHDLEHVPEAKALVRKAVHCPSCHSLRVQYPQMTRHFILPTLLAQIFVFLRFIDRESYCENCHFTWARPASDFALLRRFRQRKA
jgi:hypothetical protein